MISCDLSGRVAFVTGASSGIGRHAALTLARAGAKLAVAARRSDHLMTLADMIAQAGGHALPVTMDVSDAASVADAVNTAETELGPIGILVNNAGIGGRTPLLEETVENWDRMMAINLRGPWLVAKAIANRMISNGHGGSIINIASLAGTRPIGMMGSYGTSKAALIHLTQVMAKQWAAHRIRVNVINPGYIETDINRDFLASPAGRAVAEKIPLGRVGTPADLDGLILLLSSEASSLMTGAAITVDGGLGLAI